MIASAILGTVALVIIGAVPSSVLSVSMSRAQANPKKDRSVELQLLWMCNTACNSRDTLPDFKWCCNHVLPMMLDFARDMPELLKPRISIDGWFHRYRFVQLKLRKWWLLRVVVCIFLNQTQLSVCDILAEAGARQRCWSCVVTSAAWPYWRGQICWEDPGSASFWTPRPQFFGFKGFRCFARAMCAHVHLVSSVSPCFTKGSVASLGSLLQSIVSWWFMMQIWQYWQCIDCWWLLQHIQVMCGLEWT